MKRKYQRYIGKNPTPLFNRYRAMLNRCRNKKCKSYNSYGARGIYVCSRWLGEFGFDNFMDDMGSPLPGMSLDRIDNDGPYSPENCRWATKSEQIENRRPFKLAKNNTSGYKHITWDKWASRWNVVVRKNKANLRLGGFKTLDEAVAVRNRYYKENGVTSSTSCTR